MPSRTPVLDGDRAAGGRVTQGVVDQVVEELRKQQRIAPDPRRRKRKAEIDLSLDRLGRPVARRVARHRHQVHDLQRLAVIRRAFGLGQGEELGREATGANRGAVHSLQLGAHLRGEIPPQHELEVHLQTRRAGFGAGAPRWRETVAASCSTRAAARADSLNASTTGEISMGDAVSGIGRKSRGDRPEQLGAHVRERTQPARHAPPGEADRRGGDQQRRHELREQNLADEAIALVQRLADLHDVSVGRAIRDEANPLAAMVAVEEPMLSRRHRRRRRQLRVPVDDLFAVRAHLEDHRVEVIVDEHLERLLRQVDARSRRVDADVVARCRAPDRAANGRRHRSPRAAPPST